MLRAHPTQFEWYGVEFSCGEKRACDKLEETAAQLQLVTQDLTDLKRRMAFRSGNPGSNVSPFGGYSPALARAKTHAGSAVIADVVAGEIERGRVRDFKAVLRYEHRAALGARLLA